METTVTFTKEEVDMLYDLIVHEMEVIENMDTSSQEEEHNAIEAINLWDGVIAKLDVKGENG